MMNVKEKMDKMWEDVKRTLKVYDECTMVYENGEWKVRVEHVITAYKDPRDKVLGTVKVDEVYTKEEQQLNYIEAFRSFPGRMTLDVKVGEAEMWQVLKKYKNDEITFQELRELLGI